MKWFRRSHPPATAKQASSPMLIPQRRYRHDVPYALPKDLEEGDRLNLQHYLFRLALKGNYVAPLETIEVKHVLDVGSGTGIWGREITQQYPAARIFGLDLEPPQTVSASSQAVLSPPHYHFLQGNVLEGCPFPNQTFDYTHMRMLCAAIPDEKLPLVLQELARVTRPGGYVELLELYALAQPGPNTKRLFEAIQLVLRARGMTLSKYEHLAELMWQAGLVTAQARRFSLPISWGDRLGRLMERDTLSGFLAFKPRVCEALKLDPAEFDRWIEALPKECAKHHSSFCFTVAFAQVGGRRS